MNATDEPTWVFRCFVCGRNPRTDHALAALKASCEKLLAGRYDIQVIDVLQNPITALEEDIVATPTLLKRSPPPPRRVVGHPADWEAVLLQLGACEKT